MAEILESFSTGSYYTLRDVAEILQVSVPTLRRAVARGELEAVRAGRRPIRISPASFEQFIADQTMKR